MAATGHGAESFIITITTTIITTTIIIYRPHEVAPSQSKSDSIPTHHKNN